MFDQELAFFISHQNELVAAYGGRTLVIRGDQVVGVYPTPLDAYSAALKEYPVGTFMIQPCEPGSGAYTVVVNPTRAA
jgi:hypothetical protein